MRDAFSNKGSFLTYLGVLPFLMCALAIVVGFERETALFFLRAYGAVIVSFISGIHWGIGMKDSQRKTVWLLATSNGIALLAWGSLLMHHAIDALITLALCLMVLLFIDNKLYSLRQTDLWFIRLRWRATLLALASMIMAGAMLS